MNKIEKIVYDTIKHNPKLKLRIRNAYQSFYDFLPNKKDYFKNPISVKEGYFFGFHDVSPFSYDGTKVLANRLTIPLRMPKNEDLLEVGFFDVTDDIFGEYIKIGESRAWNYHKGCRLQWAGESKIIFNDIFDGKLVSRTFNIHDKKTKVVPFPIDSVSKCGKLATSFSYARLEMTMPGYGYPHEDSSFMEKKIPDSTGLFIGDIENGTIELVVNIHELNESGSLKFHSIEDAHQYVTHSLFSPDGRYVSFLYRATVIKNHTKRWSQLVVYDRETKQMYFSPTNEMVSHYVWNNLNQIIAYCRVEGKDSHVLFEDYRLQNYKRIAYPQLNSDGHQSFISDTGFITDTYPDKYRMSKLYQVDMMTNKVNLLASLNSLKKFQSKSYRHWCCDLHPRMNRTGSIACFDSVHTGSRALCLMKL